MRRSNITNACSRINLLNREPLVEHSTLQSVYGGAPAGLLSGARGYFD